MVISENDSPSSALIKDDRSRIDNPLAMLRDHNGNGTFEDNEVFVFTKDHLNSVRDLTDHNQKLIQRYNYSAYGKTKVERVNSGADHRFVENYFTYTAREWEPETAMICHRARCQEGTGRWMSEDPEGFKGKDNNLYNMVKNNPINYSDPEGAQAQLGAALVVGCGVGIVLVGVNSYVESSRNEQCESKFGDPVGKIGDAAKLKERLEQNKACKQKTADQALIDNMWDVVTGSVGEK